MEKKDDNKHNRKYIRGDKYYGETRGRLQRAAILSQMVKGRGHLSKDINEVVESQLG